MSVNTKAVSQATNTKATKRSEFSEDLVHAFSPKTIVADFKTLSLVDWVILLIMLVTQLVAFFMVKDFGTLGVIGLITGLSTCIGLMMVNKGLVTNYFWGTIGSTVWLIIAISHMLIGDVSSQMYYFVMQFVGIYAWGRSMRKTGKNHVESKGITKLMGVGIVIMTAAIYSAVLFLSKGLNGNQVYLDATLLPLGIVGQLLMTYGYRSQWVFWIALNAVNVVIWYNQIGSGPSAISMFVLQIVMLINSFYGAYCWAPEKEEA